MVRVRRLWLGLVLVAMTGLALPLAIPAVAYGTSPDMGEATTEDWGLPGDAEESSTGDADEPMGEEATPDGMTVSETGDAQDELAEDPDGVQEPAPGLEAQGSEAMRLSYQAHVESIGWQDRVGDGAVAGTSGQRLRVEALRINVVDAGGTTVEGAIRYRAHVENVGWQDWVGDGAVAGTSGQRLRVEALMIQLCGALAETHDVYYRVHVKHLGWLAWASNGAAAGTSGQGLRIEGVQACLCERGVTPAVGDDLVTRDFAFSGNRGAVVSAHVQNVGWLSGVGSGAAAGVTGRSLRLEAFRASVVSLPYEGSIVYAAHVQNVGWQDEVSDGAMAGTSGRRLRIEAVTFRLTGELDGLFDVYYRVHVATFGWLGWTHDGAPAGTASMGKRVEALQVALVAVGEEPPSDPGFANGIAFVSGASVGYAAQMQDGAWVEASNGGTAGATGRAMPVSLVSASVTVPDGLDGGIAYSVSSDGMTWHDASDGGVIGGNGSTIESVRITLSGTLARFFDVYYRTHVSSYGWEDWACDGAVAGTSGYGYVIEALQVKLVARGKDAPGSVTYPYFDNAGSSFGQLFAHAGIRQRSVVSATQVVPSPGAGLCAGWVSQVFVQAGVGNFGGDACDQYWQWCRHDRLTDLKVGMIVAVPQHSHTVLGRIYGHVGVYVGDGRLRDNVGHIRIISIKDWIAYYGDMATPRWGWIGGVSLA